jgi:hypothetical protein
MDFLFRASESHQSDTPSAWRPRRLRSSPTPGCSTLTTSAPNSPRSVAHIGAAMNVARSRTTSPSSAPTAVKTKPRGQAQTLTFPETPKCGPDPGL